jgi:hypothetical protein
MSRFAPNSTIVLVHGAWADGSCWQNVILPLQAEGLQVTCAPIPLTSLEDDIAALNRVLERAKGPAVLVAHAYGGAVIAGPNKIYQIARTDVRAGLRGSQVRVEVRLDDSLAVRFRNDYLATAECHGRLPSEVPGKVARKPSPPRQKSQWMKNFHLTSQEKTALSVIPSASPSTTAKGNR